MRIWSNKGMGAIECRYSIMGLVFAPASDAFGDAIIIIAALLEDRGCV
jgi:hypothetical protein